MEDRVLEKLMALDEPLEGGKDGIDYPGLGFTEADAPSLLALAKGEHLEESQAGEEDWDAECDASIHATRLLASLKDINYLEELLELLRCADQNQDEFFLEDFSFLMKLMGSGATQVLREQLPNRNETEGFRNSVLCALDEELVQEGGKDELAKVLAELLEAGHPDYIFNAFAVCSLMDFKASQYIDVIRKAIEADVINLSICGDLEDVEIGLGIREKRVTPAPDYSALGEKYRHIAKKAELGELDSDAGDIEVLSYYLALYGLPESLIRVEQLDGLILAAILAPTPVAISKLLSTVWDGKEGREQPTWDNQEDLERFYGAFIDFYNSIVAHLEKGAYEPLISVKQAEDGTKIETYSMWLSGFGTGLSQWQDDAPSTKPIVEALFGCMTKMVIHEFGGDTRLTTIPNELIEELVNNIYLLDDKNKAHAAQTFSKDPARQRTGRNEPCPCGSGKKYKRCCMGNDRVPDNLISLN